MRWIGSAILPLHCRGMRAVRPRYLGISRNARASPQRLDGFHLTIELGSNCLCSFAAAQAIADLLPDLYRQLLDRRGFRQPEREASFM